MRITGRQLRQIIKEEVSRAALSQKTRRSLNEGPAASINEVIDTVQALEDRINQKMGTNFGAAVAGVVAAYKGKPNESSKAKSILASAKTEYMGNESYVDYVPSMIEIVFAMNGKTVKGQRSTAPRDYFAGETRILNQTPDEAMIDRVDAAGVFLAQHLGA